MRYTGEAAMEERTLRDIERWKDKIEVRLDNRQVFFLFFGSALVACLLFVLGVVVGKRLESRGRAATPEVQDPLALLDRVAAMPAGEDEGLTFPKTLIRGSQHPGERGRKAALITKEPERALPVKETAKASPEPKPVEVEAAPVATPPVVAETPAKAPKAEPARVEKAEPVKVSEPESKPTKAAAAREEGEAHKPEKLASGDAKSRFALQIGSFQDRQEAEAFAARFQGEGPYIVESSIPDKGVWYRVRIGSYDDNKAAVTAKAEFERRHKIIAYVAPR